jgi:hypothetical protein
MHDEEEEEISGFEPKGVNEKHNKMHRRNE